MKSFRWIAALTAMLMLGVAATAQAAPITIGSPLTGTFVKGVATAGSGTFLNLSFAEPGALPTSPVTGAVIRWSVIDASGPFRLRVLRPAGGAVYTAVASSPTATASGGFGTGIQTFAAAVPINAGDAIGLDIAEGNEIGVHQGEPGDSAAAWSPPIPDGATEPYAKSEEEFEAGYDAVVQPAPTLTALSPASGSIKGGTAVTVAGTGFANVSGVSFGGVPAKSFTVANEGQLTAVAPASKKLSTVDVTVTTIAGTTPLTAADKFTYKACVVPKLKGKKLKAAKKKLRKAGCKPGKVKRLKGVTAKAGKVVKQSPKPGKKLAPGTKVKVTLG
jgi:PASTA domain/IPT/TIG domain